MQTLTLAGISVVVSDAMCAALLDFVLALAGSGEVASVSIPVLDSDDRPTRAQINLGAHSQLIFIDRGNGRANLDDDEGVADVVERTAALPIKRPHEYSEPRPADEISDWDGI